MQTMLRMRRPAAFFRSGAAGTMLVVVLCMTFTTQRTQAFSDSFSDGDFTSPAWTGDVSNWTIVANSSAGPGASGSQTLRLNTATATAGVQQLRTPISTWGTAQQWSFWFGRRTQSATASNRLVFWLYASEASLTSATVDGYALTFGDDAGGDELRLVRMDNGAETVLATSATAVPNNVVDYGISVRVVRSAAGAWQLYTSTLATLSNGGGVAANETDVPLFLQATATDTVYTPLSGGYAGIVASHTSGANPRSSVEFDQFLLTSGFAVHSVSPAPNALHITAGSDIAIALTSAPDAATITPATMCIHGSVSGSLSARGVFSVDGTIATWAHPDVEFEPGEIITVTATAGVHSEEGAAIEQPYTWQFSIASGSAALRFGRVWSQGGTSASVEEVWTADLNSDGDPDIIENNGLLRVRLNDGTGVCTTAWEAQKGGPIALADMNSDSISDIVVSSGGAADGNELLLGNGDGTFTSVWSELPTTATQITALVAGDFNGDGMVDVIESTGVNGKRLWLGAGDSTMVLGWVESPGDYRHCSAMVAGDFDNDGDLDIYEGNDGGNSGNRLWANDGAGNFAIAWSEGSNGNSTVSVAAGDVDGDGDLDIVEGTAQANSVRVWENNGSGAFSEGWVQTSEYRTERIALADMDGDGDADIVQTTDGDSTMILVNNGTGQWTTTTVVRQQGITSMRGLAIADFDGDNDMDMYIAASSGSALWRNLTPPVRLDAQAPAMAQSGDDIPIAITVVDASGEFHLATETALRVMYDTTALTCIGGSTQILMPGGAASTTAVLAFRAEIATTTTITIAVSTGEQVLATTVSVSIIPLCQAVATHLHDDGPGSLRRCVAAVCSGGSVVFATTGTISLQNGEIAITRNVAVDGTNADITVSGGDASRVFSISSGAHATLANVTLQHGNAANGNGGNLLVVDGTLAMENVVVEHGSALHGGGMYLATGSTVLASNLIIRNNAATNGGGVYISSGLLSIEKAVVAGNMAFVDGGGLYIADSAYTVNTTIGGNTAERTGGGVYSTGAFASVATTISGNTASDGGGVFTDSGLFMPISTILAGNTAVLGADISRNSGEILSGGYNLVGITASVSTETWQPADRRDVHDPQLGPLQNNGGFVPTMRPHPASRAIGNGATVLHSDARGFVRSLSQTDIGAVHTSYGLAATGGSAQSTAPGSMFPEPLAIVLTDGGQPVSNAAVVFVAPSANSVTVLFANGSTSQVCTTNAEGVTHAWVTAGATSGVVSVRTLGATGACFSLVVAAYPSVVLAGATSACASAIAEYSVPITEDAVYSWAATGGSIIAGEGTHQIAVQWGDAATGMIAVTATSANQYTTSNSMSVTIHPHPIATVHVSGSTALCAGNSALLTASPAGMTYLWSTGATGQSITATTSGSYSVVITNEYGCSMQSQTESVTVLPLVVDVHVLLEGAHAGGGIMSTSLASQGLVPVEQPYNVAPFGYAGTEIISTADTSVVDWVLVEIRTSTASSTAIARKAALLLADGSVIESDGSPLHFSQMNSSSRYHIAIYHRNHLGVIGATATGADTTCTLHYTFTAEATAAYQEFMDAQKELLPGKWAMMSGDADASGIINAVDRVVVRTTTGQPGYRAADLSLDGIVNAADRVIARNNRFLTSQVP